MKGLFIWECVPALVIFNSDLDVDCWVDADGWWWMVVFINRQEPKRVFINIHLPMIGQSVSELELTSLCFKFI